MNNTALFIWRFQPFHKWHLDAIKQILNENQNLIIVIWSSNKTGTEKNPLDNETRLRLIKKILIREKIDLNKIQFYFAPDFNDWEKWKKHILENIWRFHTVYSASYHTLNYFSDSHQTKLLNININISATKIRNMIRNNDKNWVNWTWINENEAKIIKNH